MYKSLAHTKFFRSFFSIIALLSILVNTQTVFAETGSSTEQQEAALIPLRVPIASVNLDVPSQVLVRDDVAFTVTFSNTGADPGFAPFIDLVIPAAAGLGANSITVSYAGTSITPDVQTFALNGGINQVTHPYVRDSSGNLITVDSSTIDASIVSGDKLVTILLPFGSFSPGQTPITVDVTVDMTAPPAQVGTPISIWARGGYRYGSTALDDWCCGDVADLTLSSWVNDSVTPELWTLTKTYSGPEDEAATGPNFRTVYPLQYTLTVDIAKGETVYNLHLVDVLPNTLQFFSVVTQTPAYTSATLPSTTTPGGTLDALYNSVTGTASSTDIVLTFDFYIPLITSVGTDVLDPVTGNDVFSCDDASVSGSWPSAVSLPQINSNVSVCDHQLELQSIAIQKSAEVEGGGILKPDAIIRNTLNFQVSDFFAFENISIRDIVSDGQHFYNAVGYEPQMSINGNSFVLAAANMASSNVDVTCDYSGTQDANCNIDDGAAYTGETWIVFDVSQEMLDRNAATNGWMIGACVNPSGGSATPNCATYNDGVTSGQIIFYTMALDNFTDSYDDPGNSGDASLDQGDTINNIGEYIRGDLLDTNTLLPASPTPEQEEDDTGADLSVPLGAVSKSVYAVTEPDGVTTTYYAPNDLVHIKPGDTVTYRITYTMPISNEENLHLIDYLPLPIFDVDDPDANDYPAHANGPAWAFDATVSAAVPPAGVVKFGPSDTFYNYMSTGNGSTGTASGNIRHPAATIMPTVNSLSLSNSVIVAFPSYNDTRLTSTTVDILVSVKVSNEPFADQLLLTNEAYAYEGSTNGGLVEATKINQVILDEPLLITTKSAIWAGRWNGASWDAQPDATFSSSFPVTILDPSSPVRWSGTITDGSSVDANVSHVDSGDVVSFMILIDNAGHSNNGAFDLIIKDSLPSIFNLPTAPSGLNLHIYRGDGVGVDYGTGLEEIRYTGLGGAPTGFTGLSGNAGDLFGNGIRLTDPADVLGDDTPVCQAHNVGSGKDIIVITYDLQINYGTTAGTYTNTANNTNYAGENNGVNHIPSAGTTPVWEEQTTDDADTTIDTSPEKFLVDTSEAHTTGSNVAIGEIIRYRIVSTIPEGSSPNFQFQDVLPDGLTFINDDSTTVAFVSDNGIMSSGIDIVPGITCDLNGVTADATTPVSSSLCALSGANIGSSNSTTTDVDVYNTGADVYFKLGSLVNTDDDIDAEYAVLEFNALVDNTTIAGTAPRNSAGNTRNNQVQAFINGSSSGSASANVTVTIVEANISFDKEIISVPSPLDAGGVVHYRITVANGTGATVSDAKDVHILDTLASALLLPSASSPDIVITTSSSFTNNSTTSAIDVMVDTLTPGQSVVVDFYPVIQGSITPGQIVDNVGNATWTSLPGLNGTTGNSTGSNTPGTSGSTTGERDGEGTNPPNDYSATDTESFTADVLAPGKSIVSTSESHTPESGDGTAGNPRELAIGEIIRYRLAVQVTEGTSTALELVDTLPAGFTFLNDGTAAISFQANVDMTEEADLVGADNDALPPTFVIPAGRISVAGQDVTFTVGNLLNNDSDSDAEYVIVDFNVIVNNDANNNNTDLDHNEYDVVLNGTIISTSNQVETRIVEPAFGLTKTVSDAHPAPGQVVTFTLVVANSGSTTGFDVDITDGIPNELALDLGSITITPTGTVTGVVNSSTATLVHITAASMDVGAQLVITYDATVAATLNDIFVNDADTTWTSLPGANGTASNTTGSSTPGATGTVNGERNGSSGVNDYTASDSVTLTADRDFVKSLVSSNVSSTVFPDQVTIGEVLTYELVLAVPAGATDTAIITDTLSDGLAFVDCAEPGGAGANHDIVAGPNITSSNFTFAADAHGHNVASCNHGVTPVTNNPLVSNNGHSVQFDLGDIANAGSSPETITITYRVIVLDTTDNVNGVTLDNDAELKWSSGTLSTQAKPSVEIVEPDMEIEKTVDPVVASYGSIVTYEIMINHTDASLVTAYDVVVSDEVPTGLVLDETSVQVETTDGGQGAPIGQAIITTPTSVTVRWDAFPLDATATITFNVIFSGPAPVLNSANLEWSSLQIDPAPRLVPQSTYNSASTERRYDPLATSGPNTYGSSSTAQLDLLRRLPRTGFAPRVVTELPAKPADFTYNVMSGIWLEIPRLGVKVDIVGVPLEQFDWNLTWLGNQAGYLDGTAYPTHTGNSAITAHAYLADGTPGPFVKLDSLRYGDQIIIHLGGQKYVYELRENKLVKPNAVSSALKHETYPWLTLITCKSYSETTKDYVYRSVVRAVLVKVVDE